MTPWTLYQLEYLQANLDNFTNRQLAEVLGKSLFNIQDKLMQEGWRRSNIKRWTAEELQWIRDNAHLGEPGLAKELGVKQSKIRALLRNHKIRTGNNSRFTKYFNPWNAGKHLRMSPKSEFKKGMTPANTLHDGAITLRGDKSGIKYKHIRIAPAKWVLYHRYLWEQHYGPVPAGHLVTFKDGNQLNCTIDNLQLMSKRDNVLRNINRAKAKLSLADSWEDGTRYENDAWIAKLIARGDKQLQADLLQNKELLETKRQQLLLRRRLQSTGA